MEDLEEYGKSCSKRVSIILYTLSYIYCDVTFIINHKSFFLLQIKVEGTDTAEMYFRIRRPTNVSILTSSNT